MPRFTDENLAANEALVDGGRAVAEAHGVLPGQVALAWVHAQGDDVVPIPGTKRVEYLEQNVAALDVTSPRTTWPGWTGSRQQVAGGRY